MLAGELRDAVGAVGRGEGGLGDGVEGVVAVDARARAVDKGVELARARGLEEALRREHVAVEVAAERVAPGAPHSRLGGEVDDRVDAVHDRGEVGAREVGLDEARLRVGAHRGEVALLDRAIVVRVERVHGRDGVAVGQKPLGDVGADEAGRTGDEDAHRGSLASPRGGHAGFHAVTPTGTGRSSSCASPASRAQPATSSDVWWLWSRGASQSWTTCAHSPQLARGNFVPE